MTLAPSLFRASRMLQGTHGRGMLVCMSAGCWGRGWQALGTFSSAAVVGDLAPSSSSPCTKMPGGRWVGNRTTKHWALTSKAHRWRDYWPQLHLPNKPPKRGKQKPKQKTMASRRAAVRHPSPPHTPPPRRRRPPRHHPAGGGAGRQAGVEQATNGHALGSTAGGTPRFNQQHMPPHSKNTSWCSAAQVAAAQPRRPGGRLTSSSCRWGTRGRGRAG